MLLGRGDVIAGNLGGAFCVSEVRGEIKREGEGWRSGGEKEGEKSERGETRRITKGSDLENSDK